MISNYEFYRIGVLYYWLHFSHNQMAEKRADFDLIKKTRDKFLEEFMTLMDDKVRIPFNLRDFQHSPQSYLESLLRKFEISYPEYEDYFLLGIPVAVLQLNILTKGQVSFSEENRTALLEKLEKLNIEGKLISGNNVVEKIGNNIIKQEMEKSDKSITIIGDGGTVITGGTDIIVKNIFDNENNYSIVVDEINKLRDVLENTASEDSEWQDISHLAKAKRAAKEKNKEKLLEQLKKCGKWVWDTANQIGVKVLAEIVTKGIN